MREGFRKFLLLLIFLAFFAWLLITGVSDLTNKEDLYTLNLDGCVEILEVRKGIFHGLIPTGSEHYYFAYDNEADAACLIKASDSWYKDNFDENLDAKKSDGIPVTALAKKPNSKISTKLTSQLNEISNSISYWEEVHFAVDPPYVLEINYKNNAIEKLALLAVGLILVVLAIITIKRDQILRNIPLKITGIIFMILFLKVIL